MSYILFQSLKLNMNYPNVVTCLYQECHHMWYLKGRDLDINKIRPFSYSITKTSHMIINISDMLTSS